MPYFSRKILLTAALTCFVVASCAEPAWAKRVSHKHHLVHHGKHVKRVVNSSEITRIAQRHLSNLGYYNGRLDGVMGPQTRAAITKFQREHNLKTDGVLGGNTRMALENADMPVLHGGPVVHGGLPTESQAEIQQDYTTSLNGDAKVVSSRFARLDVSETGTGSAKRYNINLNGQAILVADGQASVIGISKTYDMGAQDAVIFTTFSPSDTGCIYRNHALVMNNNGSKILDVGNCTRDYHAQVNNGSLYVTFDEPDDTRAVGATWRVEGESAERL